MGGIRKCRSTENIKPCFSISGLRWHGCCFFSSVLEQSLLFGCHFQALSFRVPANSWAGGMRPGKELIIFFLNLFPLLMDLELICK